MKLDLFPIIIGLTQIELSLYTWQVLVSPVLVRVFESSGAVDFSGVGAHLIQDIELLLVTSTLVGGIY